jgi:hypothetical protein
MQIKPIAHLGREEVIELARNAAENGEPLHTANVFAPDSTQHAWFTHAYWARHRELVEAEA